jgi:hypothetical protein
VDFPSLVAVIRASASLNAVPSGFEKWSVRKEPELWQDSIDESGKDGPGGWGTVLRRALRRALTDGGANLT